MIKRNTMLTYIMADHLLIFHSLHGVSSSPKYGKKLPRRRGQPKTPHLLSIFNILPIFVICTYYPLTKITFRQP